MVLSMTFVAFRLWIDLEHLRLTGPNASLEAADGIFQTYITPSADKVVKLDTRLVRGMEAYLYGM